jgi:hypothetical protein
MKSIGVSVAWEAGEFRFGSSGGTAHMRRAHHRCTSAAFQGGFAIRGHVSRTMRTNRSATDGGCPAGNFRMSAMRKLPVVPVCRRMRILIFVKQLDLDPKSVV